MLPTLSALGGTCHTCQSLSEFNFPQPQHPPTSTRRSLTAHPWSTPLGAWVPLRSDTPAPHQHQPGPAPPGQRQLPAQKEELVGGEGDGKTQTCKPW